MGETMERDNVVLGRLEKVDLHEFWGGDMAEFTPWLAEAENLRFLGESIGSELELEARESDLGPFRADILCKDKATDHWVLIENQLERTDHTYLGQLMTHAAGLEAVTIIWIAVTFAGEHRATLDWLNDITDGRFNFFGVEVEFWKIGESHVAPKFNVVCGPSHWKESASSSVSTGSSEALSETKMIQKKFWVAFTEYVKSQDTIIKPQKPLPQSWLNVPIGRRGFHLTAVASFWDSVAESFDSHELRVELAIDDKNFHLYFAMLESRKGEIEAELGETLDWHNLPDEGRSLVFIRKSTDLKDTDSWSKEHVWLLEKLEAFHRAFAGRVKMLRLAKGAE